MKVLKRTLIFKLGLLLIKEKLNFIISKLIKLVKLINYKIIMKDLAIVIIHKLTESTTIIVVVLIINNFKLLLEMINSMLKLIQRGLAFLHIKIKNITQPLSQKGIATLDQQKNQEFSIDFTEGS